MINYCILATQPVLPFHENEKEAILFSRPIYGRAACCVNSEPFGLISISFKGKQLFTRNQKSISIQLISENLENEFGGIH